MDYTDISYYLDKARSDILTAISLANKMVFDKVEDIALLSDLMTDFSELDERLLSCIDKSNIVTDRFEEYIKK